MLHHSSTGGLTVSVIVSSLVFGLILESRTSVQVCSITLTGAAFGLMRVFSGSTVAASLMHAVYNTSLWLLWITFA